MSELKSQIVKIRRALFSLSDKSGCVELAQAMQATGTEIVASGKTASTLRDGGVKVTLVEQVSGNPEAFQGRMKTLSFNVCSGILFRRGDAQDEADAQRLGVAPIDAVVVNFYPFEEAARKPGITESALVEEIDVGGPTMVRAAAKNAPQVVVLTDPAQYGQVISNLKEWGGVSPEVSRQCAARAWDRVREYDFAIAEKFGETAMNSSLNLRYGENPHQAGKLEVNATSPISWNERLTATELSYNNILDVSAAYGLASDLIRIGQQAGKKTHQGVVIIKHNNPCGVACSWSGSSQLEVLEAAWAGDPVSAFGGVLVFTQPLEPETAAWLAPRFVELVAAPGLKRGVGTPLETLCAKRKNLKALDILRFGEEASQVEVHVPGATLYQASDAGSGFASITSEEFKGVTRTEWPQAKSVLGWFGVAVCRSLKSNAIAIVREKTTNAGSLFQLLGAGQGQPNRIEALKLLALPRAMATLKLDSGDSYPPTLAQAEALLVSDAFFPFRDSIDALAEGGIRWVVQPGGSIKDAEVVAACDERGIGMALTGRRHFRH